MASIHPHPKSPFWMAHFFKQGTRTTKSTRLPATEENRERAQQIAETWEKAAAMAGEGRDGREWMLSTLNELFGEQKLPVIEKERESWQSVSGRWLAQQKTRWKVSPSTYADRKSSIDSFTKFLGPKAKNDVAAISPRDVDQWVASMLERGTASTARHRLSHVQAVFRWAVNFEILNRSPAAAVQLTNAGGLTRTPFTLAEVAKLIDHARREAADGMPDAAERLTLVLLGVCTGARLMDCARMRWESVDLANRRIAYLPQKKAKGQQVLVVALVEPLFSHLARLPREGEFLCPRLARLTTSPVSQQFIRLLERAGITGTRRTEGRARAFHDKTFHALRHTLATMLLEAGVDDLTRRRITGHENREVAAIYQHVSVESTGVALNRVLAPIQSAG
jgi:integrase